MAEEDDKLSRDYTRNRELSWLQFDQRVLEESEEEDIPLLERLRFISIFCTNLDEFFEVRVGSLSDAAVFEPRKKDSNSFDTPSEQLEAIFGRIPDMLLRRDKDYRRLMKELSREGIREVRFQKLRKKESEQLRAYYKMHIKPLLSPLIIDSAHPFPHLDNKALYIAALLREGAEGAAKKGKAAKAAKAARQAGYKGLGRKYLGLIAVPAALPQVYYLSTGDSIRFMRMEEIILGFAGKLFSRYVIEEKAVIRVTRNADISLEEEEEGGHEYGPEYREYVAKLLKVRNRLAPVRLEIEGKEEETALLTEKLSAHLGLSAEQIYHHSAPAVISWAYQVGAERTDLLYPPFRPAWPTYLAKDIPIREQISRGDVLLFYPYHSMEPFIELLKQAASDPECIAIDITLYRLARHSQVARYLAEAADNGKEVTVLVELRARFDEEHNIEYARLMEAAGCRVIYGQEGYKCHSKICLITYRDRHGEPSRIIQVGTGNYNENTATMYTDFALMSSDPVLTKNGAAFFRDMQSGDLNDSYEGLLIAPHDMKKGLMELIDQEIEKGSEGRIIIKANSVTERDLIDKLAEASQAGVKIDLIVRGICCLLPGVKDRTDHISVTSIVGRFLEHSRVYSFGTGEDRVMYISSADIMTRNQVRRVEIACPVQTKAHKDFISSYLDLLLSDNVNARSLIPPGEYIRKDLRNHERVDVHQYYIDHGISFEPVHQSRWARFRRFLDRVFS